MQVPCFLLLAVARVLGADSVEDDRHGVKVEDFNFDVDYRDFNETADLVTEASTKATSPVQIYTSNGHEGKTILGDTMSLGTEHDVFPMQNLTYELSRDCKYFDCSGQSDHRWPGVNHFPQMLLLLSITACAIAFLIVLAVLRLKLTLQIKTWGYSPALTEDRGYELPVYRTRPTSYQPIRF